MGDPWHGRTLGDHCNRNFCGTAIGGISGLIEGNSQQFMVNAIAAIAALSLLL